MLKKILAFINFLIVPPAIFILSLVISITLVNVNKNYQQAKSLNTNRALWAKKKINHYRYTLETTGGNINQVPSTVEIKDGEVISVTLSDFKDINGNLVKPSSEYQLQNSVRINNYETVEKLFESVERVIQNEYDEVLIKYDSEYGFPTCIWKRKDKRLSHGDFGVVITDFRVLD